MNPYKTNNNWIQCRSKRFSGKIYFFNISTGEAVWSCDDTENADPKSKDNEEQAHPEPHSPPGNSPPWNPVQRNVNQNPFVLTNPTLNNDMALSMYMSPFDNPYMRPYPMLHFPMLWPQPMFTPYLGQNTNMLPMPAIPQRELFEQNRTYQDMRVHTGRQPINKYFRDPVIKFNPDKFVDPRMYNIFNMNIPEFGCESPKNSPVSEKLSSGAKSQSSCETNINLTSGSITIDKVNKKLSNEAEPRNNNNGNKFLSDTGNTIDENFNQQQTNLETLIQNNVFKSSQFKNNEQTQTNQHVFEESSKFDKTPLQKNQLKSGITDQTRHSLSYHNAGEQNIVGEYIQSHTSIVLSEKMEVKMRVLQQPFCEQHYNDQSFTITNKGVWAKQNLDARDPRKPIQSDQKLKANDLRDSFVQTESDEKVVDDNPSLLNNILDDYEQSLLEQCNNEKSPLKQKPKEDVPAESTLEDSNFFEDGYGENISPTKEENGVEDMPQDEPPNSDEHDLRRLLLAKKRKFGEETSSSYKESTKIKTTRQENTERSVPKKRVTISDNLDAIFEDSAESSAIAAVDEYAEKSQNKKWYAVADTVTLLDEYDVIERYVKSDPNCTLVLPNRVMRDFEALSRGQCPDARLVLRARHLLRTLHTKPPHVMWQTSEKKSPSSSATRAILRCCLDIMKNSRLILITNDGLLREKAETRGIKCFIAQNIKRAFTRNYENEHTGENEEPETYQTQHVSDVGKLNTASLNIIDLTEGNEQTNFKTNTIWESIDTNKQSVQIQMNKKAERNAFISKHTSNVSDQPHKHSKYETDESELIVIKPEEHYILENQSKQSENGNNRKSIRDNNELARNQQKPHDTILGIECNYKQKNIQSPTEAINKRSQHKDTNSDKTNTADTNIDIKKFLNDFSIKNIDLEHTTDCKKDEIICSFRQIMVDFSMEVLKNHNNILEAHGMRPPFSLKESIYCLGLVYGEHASVREATDVLSSLLDANGEIPRSEVVRSCACAVALAQCFESVRGEGAAGEELGGWLRAVLVSARAPPAPLSACAASAPHSPDEPAPRHNFTKSRSDVLQYLKKNFTAWADYDESAKENSPTPTWGKSYKENMVVRMYGKNLGQLTLNNSKSMSLNNPCSGDGAASSSPKQAEETNALTIINMTRSLDPRIYSKQDAALAKMRQNSSEKQNTKQNEEKQGQHLDDNQIVKETKTESKVVRLFSNYNFNKDPNEKPKQALIDDFETYGYTFGSVSEHGPKKVTNKKPIKQFEENLKHRPLEVDYLDYSTVSINGYDDFMKQINMKRSLKASEPQANTSPLNNHSDNNSHSMSLENASISNCLLDSKTNADIGDPKNDNMNSKIFDNASLDLNIFHEIYGITQHSGDNFERYNGEKNDIIEQKDDMIVSQNDEIPASEYMSEYSCHFRYTLLAESNVYFCAIGKFIASCVVALRGGASADLRRAMHARARHCQCSLYAIIMILDKITHKMRELVQGGNRSLQGILCGNNPFMRNYREAISRCVQQVQSLNEALKVLLHLTAPAPAPAPAANILAASSSGSDWNF